MFDLLLRALADGVQDTQKPGRGRRFACTLHFSTNMAEHRDQPPAEPFSLKAFLIELAIYAVLVVAYFLLVLHLLGGWLKGLFDHERWTYAVVGLAIVVTQAALLELLSSGLLRFFRARTK